MARPPTDFIWYELMTTDPDAAADFYGAVVGWKVGDPMPGSATDYRMIVRDDGGNAGGVLGLTPEMQQGGARSAWLPYLYVTDVDASVKAIEAEGGTVQMPATDLPVGRIAMVADPQGVPIYIMDPVPPEDDPDAQSDVFAEKSLQRVGWNELASPDSDASRDFYARYFGFEFNEVMDMGAMGEYRFIDHDGRRLGAIMQRQSEEQPALWMLYFRVPGIAAAKDTIKAKGGTVIMGPMEVPGDEWIVLATDPQGAAFGLVAAQK